MLNVLTKRANAASLRLTESHLYKTCRAAAPLHTSRQRNASIADQEWLQEPLPPLPPSAVAGSSSLGPQRITSPRFDWRLCAPSRIAAPPADSRKGKQVRRTHPPQTHVEPGQPYYEAIQEYSERFLSLLAAEQEESESVLKERLSTWSLDRLQEEGYCLADLSAYWLEGTQFGRPVASFLIGPGQPLPEHRFDNGSQLLVSRIDPLTEESFRGSVVGRSPTQIRVAFPESFPLEAGTWRLDLGRSDIIFERMRTAIKHLNHDPAQQEESFLIPTPPANSSGTPNVRLRETILEGTYLRDILIRTFQPESETHAHVPLQPADDVNYLPHEALEHESRAEGDTSGAFKDDMRIMSWARRYSRPNPVRVEGDPILTGLNDPQTRAMATMIGQRMCLVQGPPGTGKTKTIIETVKLLKVHFEVPHPLLVCTYTNVAVDNLVEGLASAGLSPLRVGDDGKVRAGLRQHTLNYKLEMHPLKPELDKAADISEKLQKELDELEVRLEKEKQIHLNATPRMMNMERMKVALDKKTGYARSKIYGIQQEMLRDVVNKADVVCTTCLTSACVALRVVDFPVVFLDEASMSTEPASLIPMMKGSQQVALIGDHKQLPPVITSREALSQGLGISLFERLTEEGVVPSVMLDIQYRMHPSISRFPCSEFYNFSLQDGTVDAGGNVPLRLLPPLSRHLQMNAETGRKPSVVFLDHEGEESAKDRSRVNLNEGHIVCSVVEDLLLHNQDLRGEGIGIIAPYVAQISLLTRLLNTNVKYRERFEQVLGSHRALQLSQIEIKTVDGFEGREKEVIIFSTVRNNNGGHIGFLADRRRLNVGLTRAKRGLFVVGSISTLKAGKMGSRAKEVGVGKGVESWRRYARFLSDEGLVVQLTGENLREALYGNVLGQRQQYNKIGTN